MRFHEQQGILKCPFKKEQCLLTLNSRLHYVLPYADDSNVLISLNDILRLK